MGGVGPRVLERTLGLGEGFPRLSRQSLTYIVRRGSASLVAIAAFVFATTSAAASLEGTAVAGVVPGGAGQTVGSVSVSGFAWRDGVRPGQAVLRLDDALSPDGWRLDTRAPDGSTVVASQRLADRELRESGVLGVMAMVAGALALLVVRTRRRFVVPLSAVALFCAAVPLQLQGEALSSTAAMVLAAFVPAEWLLARITQRSHGLASGVALAAGVALALALGSWVLLRLGGTPPPAILDLLRDNVAAYGTAVVVLGSIGLPIARGRVGSVIRPALGEMMGLALLISVASLLVFTVELPPLLVLLGLLASTMLLPTFRGAVASRLGDALTADMRSAIALRAAEAERDRLARELHDSSLQHLASVIRHLDSVPGAEAQADELRQLASELRETTTGLRPPVLEDLGLGAALDFMVRQARTSVVSVTAVINDSTGPARSNRPPQEVELAAFRVAQEAVSNALEHGAATKVEVIGKVEATEVDLRVVDNGRGIELGRWRASVLAGRLGLASMRRRAEAIDADLGVDTGSAGTTIRLRWQQ